MSKIAIDVHNVSKIYKLYAKPTDRLKEALPFRRKPLHKNFYALNDINFHANKGETIGIIGKNGSGKSTLLKMITGVLTPTFGTIEVFGRVSALLELGAGFNPELTGIENVYLNGTIMGYSNAEIEHRLDDILSFADIGLFINQPVKTYSSGMFARLAFATAINVEPDILIVDETLSVGDFLFQNKCLKRIGEMQDRGVTILLVSHSTQQIIRYCNRAIMLHDGILYDDSRDVERVVFKYEELLRNSENREPIVEQTISDEFEIIENDQVEEYRFGSHDAILRDVILTNDADSFDHREILQAGERVYLKLVAISQIDCPSAVIGVSIKDVNGIAVWGDNLIEAGKHFELKKGKNIVSFSFNLNISCGEYLIYAGLADISGLERIELDQRWPVRKIEIISARRMAEGYVYAPSMVMIE